MKNILLKISYISTIVIGVLFFLAGAIALCGFFVLGFFVIIKAMPQMELKPFLIAFGIIASAVGLFYGFAHSMDMVKFGKNKLKNL